MKLHYLEIHTRVVRLFFFLKKEEIKFKIVILGAVAEGVVI